MRKLMPLMGVLMIMACVKKVDVTKVTVEARQPTIPVLVGKEQNVLLQFQLKVLDSATSYEVKAITFDLEGTTEITDIKKASVVFNYEDKSGERSIFGKQSSITEKFSVQGKMPLLNGTNFFWLRAALNGNPDLSNKVVAKITSVEFTDGSILKPYYLTSAKPQRFGIALRQHNQDKVNTYRIPGLATTDIGTLIAVYDNRYNSSVDLQADVDVGMSRSTDGGQSWQPMKVIMDMGDYGDLPHDQNGIGDPAILVDRNTGTIWVAALWAHGHPDQRTWNASGQGIAPEITGQFILVKSEDDGLTWSDPINITPQIKKPEWHLVLQGPGKGITLKDGTLVFPAQYKDKLEIPHSTIIYSKDSGKTWEIGNGAKPNTTEAQVVELEDGSLMLNMRDNRNNEALDSLHGRSIAITNDLGKTWIEHPTSRKALQESTCMASFISYIHPEKGQILFFSNPDTTKSRSQMTIKTSFDQGMTWPKENQLKIYENDGYGYSCMTVIDENHIGILYEGRKDLYFEKINVHELIKDKK